MITPATENPSSKLQIYLIRHGQTEWSQSGQHTGRTDIALTPHGEDEARRLRPWLSGIAFARVLSSPRIRALRTAELTGIATPVDVEPDLAEWDYGAFEGQRSTEIRLTNPDWSIYRDGCPGGESPEQITARADRLIDRLSLMSGNIALFSHGHFGRSIATRWIGLNLVEAQHFVLGTATVSILGFDPSHPETRVISSWNISPAP